MNKGQEEVQEFKSLEELKDYAVSKGLIVKSALSEEVAVTELTNQNAHDVMSKIEGKMAYKGFFIPDSGIIYYLTAPSAGLHSTQ